MRAQKFNKNAFFLFFLVICQIFHLWTLDQGGKGQLLSQYKFSADSPFDEGQWKTDKDDMMWGHMAIILLPVWLNAAIYQTEQRRVRSNEKTTKHSNNSNYQTLWYFLIF